MVGAGHFERRPENLDYSVWDFEPETQTGTRGMKGGIIEIHIHIN